jgi:uncharacterized surface anchored protein
LAAGDSSEITIVVEVDAATSDTITNTVDVSGDEPDPDPRNDLATEETTVQVPSSSSISGCVYVDLNRNGERDEGDRPLEGVEIALSGTDVAGNPVDLTVDTSEDGSWSFTDLAPGTYDVIQTEQPSPFIQGTNTPGTPDLGGSVEDDAFVDLVLEAGVDAVDYCFGEQLPRISKRGFLASS